MKPVMGSTTASTALKLPIRMPSGTERIEAKKKPVRMTVRLAVVLSRSEPLAIRFTAARATMSGEARKSGGVSPP